MQKKMVSIIVPVYNVMPYLDRCISSLQRQTYQEIEIILIDDGSTDESSSMCDWYGEDDPRIHIMHKPNGGLMSAWKAGVSVSRGAYLCFVDSDDWIEPCMIAEMVKYLHFTPGEVVCCNYVIDRADGMTREKHGLSPGSYEGKAAENLFTRILGNENRIISLSRCMKLISRELIVDNLQYCNEKLKMGEDVNIILPALLDSKRIVIMEDAYYYHYFYNHSSMVHAYDRGLYENIRLLRKVMITVFKDKVRRNQLDVPEGSIEEQCGREYLFLLMLVLKNEARGNHRGRSCLKNIKKICEQEKTPELCRRYPIRVIKKSDKLLYMVLKHPYRPIIGLLRMATKLFYDIRNTSQKASHNYHQSH